MHTSTGGLSVCACGHVSVVVWGECMSVVYALEPTLGGLGVAPLASC